MTWHSSGFTAGAGGRAKEAPSVGMVSCGENLYPPARKAEGSFVKMVGCREQEVFMPQVDPWEKAADCERALRITIDPIHRETLSNIREFWIALAQESRFLSDDALAAQIETIGRLHAKLDRDMHA
jgi:hypothetical protein